jgi:hypothetical protein
MGWGLWNKLKEGIKKVGGAIGKAAKYVGKKILPIATPIANYAAPLLNSVVPGLGTGISMGTKVASGISSKLFGDDDDDDIKPQLMPPPTRNAIKFDRYPEPD